MMIDFTQMTIGQIREHVAGLTPTLELVAKLRTDERKGVQKLADQLQRQIQRQEEMEERFAEMLIFEKKYWEQGLEIIVGVDEAGRGPLAGPVVAAAVVINPDFRLLGLNDSKKLSEEEREEYYDLICQQAVAYGVGVVDHQEIDQINILQASFQAMRLAIQNLTQDLNQKGVAPEIVLVDGDKVIPGLAFRQQALVGGDGRSISIAAASVLAKVTRDREMVEMEKLYPGYGFERNKGYGAPEHLQGLRELGPSPIHRLTFSVVRQATYSDQYKAYAELLTSAKEIAVLKEVGVTIGKDSGDLTLEEVQDLRELYVKCEKKLR